MASQQKELDDLYKSWSDEIGERANENWVKITNNLECAN